MALRSTLALLALFVLPQSPPPAVPRIDDLVAAHLAARGGAAAWTTVTSFVRRQTSGSLTVETAWRRAAAGRPDQMRLDQGSTEYNLYDTRGFDGTAGWTTGSNGPRLLTGAEVQQLREDVAATVELFAAKDLGLTLVLTGPDTYENAAVWRVRASFRSGREMTMLFDAKSWLEVARIRVLTAPDGSTAEIWTTFGDYREVAGLRLPHAMNDTTVTYQINVSLADDHFRRPKSPSGSATRAVVPLAAGWLAARRGLPGRPRAHTWNRERRTWRHRLS